MQRLFNILVMSCGLSAIAYAKPPYNIGCAKLAIIKYYESGEYEKDVTVATKKASALLQKKITENKHAQRPQQLAIVFDIDDTSLSSFAWYKRREFQRDDAAVLASYPKAAYPSVKPVRALYQAALKQNVKLFFISSRPESARQSTIKNLKKEGFNNWSGLYLSKQETRGVHSSNYKTAIRKQLTQQGYHIVLNVGDQETDFIGGYADYNIKIPNPLYCSSKHCA